MICYFRAKMDGFPLRLEVVFNTQTSIPSKHRSETNMGTFLQAIKKAVPAQNQYSHI